MHSAREWIRKQAHTNGIASFSALLRYSYSERHQGLPEQYSEFCVNEFATRANLCGKKIMRNTIIDGIDSTPENTAQAMFRGSIRRQTRKVTKPKGKTTYVINEAGLIRFLVKLREL